MKYITFFLSLIFFGIFLVLVPLVIACKLSPGYSFAYLLLFAPIAAAVGIFALDEITRYS